MFCKCYLKKERKQTKMWKMQQSLSRHDFRMSQHKIQEGQRNYVAASNKMSQQSSDRTPWLKKKFCSTKSFSITTLLKKIVKKTVATILDSVVTTIKVEIKEAVSRHKLFVAT